MILDCAKGLVIMWRMCEFLLFGNPFSKKIIGFDTFGAFPETSLILEHLYPRIKRGVLILDDYGTFPGETKDIDDYFRDMNISIQKFPFCMTPCYTVKV